MTDGDQEIGAGRRARWLGELAAALDEAARLAGLVGEEMGGATIRRHIAEVREEVERARRGGFQGVEQKPPKRTDFAQWRGK